MRFSTDNKIDDLVRQKQQAGWQVRKGKKHHILIAPNGRKVAIPSSPSDHRAYLNFSRDLRRLTNGDETRA